MELRVKRLTETAKLPTKAHEYDAGWDLYADEEVSIEANKDVYRIKTGISMEIPDGFCGIIKDRSSFGNKGFHILAGVIDSSYRGEIIVCMKQISFWERIIKNGDKFAQMLIVPVPYFKIKEVNELSETDRGSGGFGSTGN